MMNDLEIEAALQRAEKLGESGHWPEAIAAFRELAEEGSSHAMARLGWAYDTGSGVAASLQDAENWYRKAGESKNRWARYQAAIFLTRHRRDKEAFSLVDELAHEGYLPAIYRLSRLLASGRGTDKDPELSEYYLDYAASHGHIWAQRECAMRMLRGEKGLARIIPGLFSFLGVLTRTFRMACRMSRDGNYYDVRWER